MRYLAAEKLPLLGDRSLCGECPCMGELDSTFSGGKSDEKKISQSETPRRAGKAAFVSDERRGAKRGRRDAE